MQIQLEIDGTAYNCDLQNIATLDQYLAFMRSLQDLSPADIMEKIVDGTMVAYTIQDQDYSTELGNLNPTLGMAIVLRLVAELGKLLTSEPPESDGP